MKTSAEGFPRAGTGREILTCLAVFLAAAALLLGALTAAACIPRKAIEDNVRTSAEYLCRGKLFGKVLPEVKSSTIDRYADSILLNIAWCYDGEHPLRSVLVSSYYYTPDQNENDNLRDAVTGHLPPNQQYLRYWHGSNALVTPLLTVLDLKGIYVLHGAVLAVSAAALLIVLVRKRAYAPAIGVGAGIVAAGFWFVPLSLEYYWVCELMLLLSLGVVLLENRAGPGFWAPFFLVGGILTSYLDFLTAETLTVLVPLLLLLWLRRDLPPRRTALTLVPAWAIGYAGMWVLKWALAGLAMGEDPMAYVTEHIGERVNGGFYALGEGEDPIPLLPGAVLLNVGCLFPLDYEVAGALATVALAVFLAYYAYVYRRTGWDRTLVLTMGILGLVPYLRFLVLRNHSFLHCFFAYRAQTATVLALVLLLAETTARRRRETVEAARKRRERTE